MPKRYTIKLKRAINEKDVSNKSPYKSAHKHERALWEWRRTYKPCMLFTQGDFAHIWSSGVITLHINTARLHYIIIPSWMSSSVLSPRIQMAWIIGGNIWDSITQYRIQLLLQSSMHVCWRYVNCRGCRETKQIWSPLTPHPGGWWECSAKLTELMSKLNHA